MLKRWVIWIGLFLVGGAAARADVTIGVKDARQIFDSLSIALAVNPGSTDDIRSYFEEARSRLPRKGEVTEFTSPMLTTVATLSGYFCKSLIDSDALKADPKSRWVHQGVDFTKKPSDLSPQVRAALFESYTGLFWARSPSVEEAKALELAMTVAIREEPSTVEATKSVLLVPCVAVASSLDSLTY